MNGFQQLALSSLLLLGACGGNGHTNGNTNPGQPLSTNSVTGTITFKGAPLPGAKVILFQTNISTITQTTTTDASGHYTFSELPAWSNVAADFLIWPLKVGLAFYPSVGSGAKVTRQGQNAFLQGMNTGGIGMDVTAIEYISTPNAPLSGANFTAYDGSTPQVSLPRTGQVTSYANGDDASHSAGVAWPTQRFTDNGDGSIMDHLTGLVWLKNAGAFAPTTWTQAIGQVNALASGTSGLTDGSRAGDWRLPNLHELESLVDASTSSPALPNGHPFTNVSSGIYWTSTSYYGGIGGSSSAWAIRLDDGRYINDSVANAKTAVNGVWAVRGGSGGAVKLRATGLWTGYTPGDDGTLQTGVRLLYPRWIDNGNGTVTDTMTGLIWLKQADAIHLPWAQALAAVNALASGQYGLTDGSTAGSWRMPTRLEMQSLSDRQQNNHADYFNHTFLNLDGSVYQAAVFTNFIGFQYYWTSTTDAADPTKAWTVFSCDFGVYDTAKAGSGYTLAVR